MSASGLWVDRGALFAYKEEVEEALKEVDWWLLENMELDDPGNNLLVKESLEIDGSVTDSVLRKNGECGVKIADWRMLNRRLGRAKNILEITNNAFSRLYFQWRETRSGRRIPHDYGVQTIPFDMRQCFKPTIAEREFVSIDLQDLEFVIAGGVSGDGQIAKDFYLRDGTFNTSAFQWLASQFGVVYHPDIKRLVYWLLYCPDGPADDAFVDMSGKWVGVFSKLVKRYPVLVEWLDKKKKEAVKNKVVKTLFGRRISEPSSNYVMKGYMNGSCQDILDALLIEFYAKAQVVLVEHRVILLEVVKEHTKRFVDSVVDDVEKLAVGTLKSDYVVRIGDTWEDVTPLPKKFSICYGQP
jgi:hypothetical protein